MELTGAFRDSVSNTWNTCFPSGIFASFRPTQVQRGITGIIAGIGVGLGVVGLYSFTLFFLFGKYLKLTVENVDLGMYIDFRRSQTNGFYVRGSMRVKLFDLFNININAEIQHVNGIELKRRLRSMNSVNMCPDYEMTQVNAFILKHIGR